MGRASAHARGGRNWGIARWKEGKGDQGEMSETAALAVSWRHEGDRGETRSRELLAARGKRDEEGGEVSREERVTGERRGRAWCLLSWRREGGIERERLDRAPWCLGLG